MSGRVDVRGPVERAEDVILAAEFDLMHDEKLARCECGATLRRHVGSFTLCAGCGLAPLYRLHPAPVLAQSFSGDWERSAPPEVSAGSALSARKDADAPDHRVSARPGSGVLGRFGNALRSLRLLDWVLIFAIVPAMAFWALLVYIVGFWL